MHNLQVSIRHVDFYLLYKYLEKISSALVGAASSAITTVILPVRSSGSLNAIDARMKPAFANAEVVLQALSNNFKFFLPLQFNKKVDTRIVFLFELFALFKTTH